MFILQTVILNRWKSKIKNSSWEKYHNSDRFVDIDGSEEGVFTLLYENQDFFLGYIADKKKKGNYMQPFLYDKMKDKTYLLRWCDYYEHLKELDYFEGYEARGIFEDYFIAHVSFSTLDQYNIFERVKDGALKITNPELERVIQNLNTDSNPVLILTKFKHLWYAKVYEMAFITGYRGKYFLTGNENK